MYSKRNSVNPISGVIRRIIRRKKAIGILLQRKGNYFKGWYFKNQKDHEIISLIPAYHMDEAGNRSASLQIITPKEAYQIFYPMEEFTQSKSRLVLRIGNCSFSEKGIHINIHTEKVEAFGRLTFSPFTPLRYDIMGPFRYVPFMQCRHSVYSLAHRIDGRLTLNGTTYTFHEGTGYIEGDRGSSFPGNYLWTQCSFPGTGQNMVMISVATVLIGKRISFGGCIGVVYYEGKEYRFATYLGVKIHKFTENELWLRQRGYLLEIRILEKFENCLLAPVKGKMVRKVYESVNARIQYRFSIDGRVIFDEIGTGCFERGL